VRQLNGCQKSNELRDNSKQQTISSLVLDFFPSAVSGWCPIDDLQSTPELSCCESAA